MSVVKSQNYEESKISKYATIRSRGLHRSNTNISTNHYDDIKSNKSSSSYNEDEIKTTNGSLIYENGNNDDLYGSMTKSSKTFKPIENNDYKTIVKTTHELLEKCNVSYSSLPPMSIKTITPPTSPTYISINGFSTNGSISSSSGEYGQLNFYSRPESPRYGKIGYNRLNLPDKPNQKIQKPTFLEYNEKEEILVTKKPPFSSSTSNLKQQYRNERNDPLSFSCPSDRKNYHYSSSNGSINSCQTIDELDDDLINCNLKLSPPKLRGFERRYATLGHQPRDQLQKHQLSRIGNNYSTLDITRLSLKYLDYESLMDYKVGCQTTLRSKPVIPWYELAIKKDFRRQSCPPFEEAHVVAAFEQSLTTMTGRLHQLTANAEKKDSELLELRQTIERLRKSSIQAGLTSAHMQSMGVQPNNNNNHINNSNNNNNINGNSNLNQTNHHNGSSDNTNNSNSTNTTINTNGSMQRHHSTDSMCSLNSLSSGCSAQEKKKKKGWLRSSFTKAFSRNAKISKTNRNVIGGNISSTPEHSQTHVPPPQTSTTATIDAALPPASPSKSPHKIVTLVENAKPVDAIEDVNNPVVEDLKKQLREKDLVLTDIRLEALSSASQLETLKETVLRMRAEMMNLKQNNERLQKLVTSRSLAGSEVSLGALGSGINLTGGGPVSPNGSLNEPRRYSLVDGIPRPPLELPKSLEETEEENIPPAPAPDSLTSISPTTHIDLTPPPKLDVPSSEILSSSQVVEETGDMDGKRIAIAVYIGQTESFLRYSEDINECDNYYSNNLLDNQNLENGYDNNYHQLNPYEFIIAYTYISGKTTWQNLDYIVRKTFKDYLAKIDPGTNLALNTDSITSYHLGEAKRGPEMGFPELLPCGYIVGNVRSLYICLQGVGSLAFDSLIPKSIVHRYISLLNEHRRLILCGPSGTGKSYLARKLAEFLVARSGRGNIAEAIACFNVDHKSSKELRQYLTHIVEQASMSNGASELPSVIILDNLHHTSGDVFSCLTGPITKLPCIIGIMSQATCNTTNLQLHHNFRWVLTANHMEPVKGFLGRFLRRRLYQLELQTSTAQPQLAAVFAWLPTVWQHINRFLETHSSSDVTIGPRLFLSCPLDIKDSQVWFTDVWNYHLAPYLVEAVREGVQLYGRRGGAWVDPSTYIKDSYPWPQPPSSVSPLRQITAEDVGLESDPPDDSETQDPLLNMLLRLQEAANYADKEEQESDCASLDSNITQDSSAGAE